MSARWPFRASRAATLALTCSASSGESRLIRVQAHHLERHQSKHTHTKTHTEKKSRARKIDFLFVHKVVSLTVNIILQRGFFYSSSSLTSFKPNETNKKTFRMKASEESLMEGRRKKKINAQRGLWAQGNKRLQMDSSG